MNLLEILTYIAIGLSIASYFNGERLRRRLNNLEDILMEKGLVSRKDIVEKIIAK